MDKSLTGIILAVLNTPFGYGAMVMAFAALLIQPQVDRLSNDLHSVNASLDRLITVIEVKEAHK